MKRWGIRFLLGLLILVTFVACAGNRAEVQSTPEVVADVTPTLPLTARPVPTSTPQPTTTVAPTATIEATSTPQVGDSRVNPVSGSAEVYSEDEGWVELPQVWNIEERGSIPYGMTKENAEFIGNDDGSTNFVFTLNDRRHPENGKKFIYTIPAFGVEGLLDRGLDIVPVYFEGSFSDHGYAWPLAWLISEADGEILAIWHWGQAEWVEKYEVILADLDQLPAEDWMPELGVLDGHVNRQDGSDGEIVGDFLQIAVVLQNLMVIDAHLLRGGGEYKTVTYLVSQDSWDNTIWIPIFSSDVDLMSGIQFLREGNSYDFVSKPYRYQLDGNFIKPHQKEDILDALANSSRVVLDTAIFPASFVREYNPSQWQPSTFDSRPTQHYFWSASAQVAEPENYQKLVDYAESIISDEPIQIGEFWTGYNALGIFVND